MSQPRGALAEVVPEWKLVVYVLLPCEMVGDPFAGAKRLPSVADSPQLQQEMKQLFGASVLRVGIPWDPIEFIGKAGKLGHPFHQLSKSNKPLEELIEQLVHKLSAVRSRRKNYIDRWARRAKELQQRRQD